MRLLTQLRTKPGITTPIKDILSGIIVALVSIPISMGYASIAGLPVIYGLYGSLLPILAYGLLTTSPQFVVGVDAMPAVMVGTLLAEFGIIAESDEALQIVPLISFLVALWFIIFYLVKAGRIVKYISTPVMGGFISGVGITIILMQIPKLFGGSPGTGELFFLLGNIYGQLPKFNIVSFCLAIATMAIILISKRLIPKIPMTAVMLFAGAGIQAVFHLEQYGVVMLPSVDAGLPVLKLPHLELIATHPEDIIVESLSIAAVIMAQTLLATGKYASKYGYSVDNNKELLAYSAMNIAGSAVGCCPINGSVSRSGIADSFGTRSQLMSVSAALSMLIVILFGTPLLGLLPVPILTAIVMTALLGIIERELSRRLWASSRNEWFVFFFALMAVLLLGTVYGVIVGCLLSFGEVAVRAVAPPTSFVGRIQGQGNFYSLKRNSNAYPIKNTVIYRFSGNLFFANIDRFENDIRAAIRPDTHTVIVDARGIGSIDITAVDRIVAIEKDLREKGLRFYITEHEGSLNDNLRAFGGISLLENGAIRRTITLALRDAGVYKPYELDYGYDRIQMPSTDIASTESTYDVTPVGADSGSAIEDDERLAEFEWLFGSDAESHLEQLAAQTAKELSSEASGDIANSHIPVLESHGASTSWGTLGLFDEQYFWDLLEMHLEKRVEKGQLSEKDAALIEKRIENRRHSGESRLAELNPHAIERLNAHREEFLRQLKEKNPDDYAQLVKLRESLRQD